MFCVEFFAVRQFEHFPINGYRTLRKTLFFREANKFICSVCSVYIVYYFK